MVIYFLWSLLREFQSHYLYACVVVRGKKERLPKVSTMRKQPHTHTHTHTHTHKYSTTGVDDESLWTVNLKSQ